MNLVNTGNVSLRGGADGRLTYCQNNRTRMLASQYHFRHLQMYSRGETGGEGKLWPGSNILEKNKIK